MEQRKRYGNQMSRHGYDSFPEKKISNDTM